MQKSDLEGMARWLESEDERVRNDSAATLGRMGLSSALCAEALASRFSHPDAKVRARAAQALGKMGPVGAQHAEFVASHIDNANPSTQKVALELLLEMGELGADNAAAVAQKLRDEDRSMRAAAADTLNRMGPAARPFADNVARELHNQSALERVWAAECLGFMGELGSRHGDELVQLAVLDPSSLVRTTAAQAVAKLGVNVNFGCLHKHLESMSVDIRKRALEVCVHLGEHNSQHIGQLMIKVWDRDPGVRILAAKALGSLGDAAMPQALELASHLNATTDIGNERNAAAALRYLGKPGAAALATKLKDDDKMIAELARRTLEDIGDVGAHWLVKSGKRPTTS